MPPEKFIAWLQESVRASTKTEAVFLTAKLLNVTSASVWRWLRGGETLPIASAFMAYIVAHPPKNSEIVKSD